jgi:hypothetical protein
MGGLYCDALFCCGIDPSSSGLPAWEYGCVEFATFHHAYLKIGVGRSNRNRQPFVWQCVNSAHIFW